MLFSFLFGLIDLVLKVYKLMLLAHFVIGLMKLPGNKWTNLLARAIEPVLPPVRRILNEYLPKNWQVCDWSPIAVFLLITVVQWVL